MGGGNFGAGGGPVSGLDFRSGHYGDMGLRHVQPSWDQVRPSNGAPSGLEANMGDPNYYGRAYKNWDPAPPQQGPFRGGLLGMFGPMRTSFTPNHPMTIGMSGNYAQDKPNPFAYGGYGGLMQAMMGYGSPMIRQMDRARRPLAIPQSMLAVPQSGTGGS